MKLIICFSGSEKDTFLVNEFKKHLRGLLVNRILENVWDLRELLGGAEVEKEYTSKLHDGNVIIPMLSPDYLDGQRTIETDIPIFEKSNRGEKIILPVILRPCTWLFFDFFKKTELFPENKEPISGEKQDEYFKELVYFLYKKIQELSYHTNPSDYKIFHDKFRSEFIESNRISNTVRKQLYSFEEDISEIMASQIKNKVLTPVILGWRKGELKTGADVNKKIKELSTIVLSSMNLRDKISNRTKLGIYNLLQQVDKLIFDFKIHSDFKGIPPNFSSLIHSSERFENDMINIGNLHSDSISSVIVYELERMSNSGCIANCRLT